MRSIWWKIATGQYKFYNSILHKKECMIQFEQIFIFTILEMKQLPLPIQPIWDVIVGYEFWFLLWIYCICTELTFDVYNNITYPWSLPLGNPPPLAIFMTLRVSWESAGRLSLVSVSISSLSCYGRFLKGFRSNNPSNGFHNPVFCRVCVSIKMTGTQNRVFWRTVPFFTLCFHKTDSLTQNLRRYEGLHHRPYKSCIIPRQHMSRLQYKVSKTSK